MQVKIVKHGEPGGIVMQIYIRVISPVTNATPELDKEPLTLPLIFELMFELPIGCATLSRVFEFRPSYNWSRDCRLPRFKVQGSTCIQRRLSIEY